MGGRSSSVLVSQCFGSITPFMIGQEKVLGLAWHIRAQPMKKNPARMQGTIWAFWVETGQSHCFINLIINHVNAVTHRCKVGNKHLYRALPVANTLYRGRN